MMGCHDGVLPDRSRVWRKSINALVPINAIPKMSSPAVATPTIAMMSIARISPVTMTVIVVLARLCTSASPRTYAA